MTDERVEPAGDDEQQPEAPRRPRHLAEVDDEDARARARGNLLTVLGDVIGR